MDSAVTALQLVLCEDPDRAEELAHKLNEINIKRQETELEIFKAAQVLLEQQPERLEDRVMLLWGRDWHPGVIGIVASRLVERTGRPVIVVTVDYLFDRIKDSEQKIVENPEMDTLQKIHTILGVMPECYQDVDFRQLYQLKEKYPEIYHQVEVRLETGWETTIALLEQGMQEGVIRPVQIPILKMMLEASLEQFFQRDILLQNEITYAQALQEVVGILMYGIASER